VTDRELADRVNRLLRELILLLRRSATDTAVSSSQLAVLASLEAGPLRMSGLAAQHGVRMPTMTAQINRLERDGLVARQRRDRDARVVTVELTGVGRLELRRGRDQRVTFLAERLAGLTEEDRRAIAEALPALSRLTQG
jgi:DNA-binding MarR family transcriptional regulator